MMLSKQWFARPTVALFLMSAVLAVVAACGGSRKSPATASSSTAPPKASAEAQTEVHERITPHTCAARTKLAQLLGHTVTPPAPASEQSAESAPPPTSVGAGSAKIAANQAYRVVAPSTVLIRTDRGMGTGVVIDPKGYILTNYHVVAEGRKQDFVVSVNVTFGDLTPTGRMSRQEKTYEAVVVKGDVIRDMAIIKVKDPPPKLEAVKLAKSAPQIAEKVISVGHAGIGFLWAAKTCSIASVGERQQDTSRLAAFDCANPDPAMSPAEAARYKTRCDETKKAMTDALAATTQGLALQTDCAITHGDSGGPLVNAAGELVGLNQSISADLATASFHVHLDEIREFSTKFPEEGIAIVPDPFCDGGPNPTLEDIDLDGIPDTLVSKGTASLFGGYDRISLLIDLDQNHFKKKASDTNKAKDNKDNKDKPKDSNKKSKDKDAKDDGKADSGMDAVDAFDAEIALLTVRETTYVWYDTDDDKRFDLLLVDKDNDGKPEQAFRIDANGKPKEDKEALPKHDFSAKLIKDPALHARLGKIAAAIGGTKYVSAKMVAAASKATAIPDPILGGGNTGRGLDSDGNGKVDVAVMRGAFSRGILIDADEDSMGSLKVGDAVDDLIKAKKVDPEVAIIVQGNSVWAVYDTDNDSKFDLALMTTNGTDPSSLLATNAWKLGGTGELTPLPDQIGRKILRPGLMSSLPRVEKAFKVISPDVAADEGMGSLPDPLLGSKVRFRARELKGVAAFTVIEAQTPASTTILVDIDHDTKIPKEKDAKEVKESDLQKVVSDGKFDAEVAIVHRNGPDGGSDWIYYDTDNDGKFDLVLFVATTGKDPTQAYRLVKNEKKLEADNAAVAGKPLRHKSIFTNKALATKWKAIAGKTFKASAIEE